MIQNILSNWKTTIAGLGMMVGSLVHIGFAIKNHALAENDLTTSILTALGGLGLIAAGDAGKSANKDDLEDLRAQLALPQRAPDPDKGITGVSGNLKVLAFALVPILALGLFGCKASLETGGVYTQMSTNSTLNSFIFGIDKSLVDSKETLNQFVTWEYQNHQTITNMWPAIAKVADNVRVSAPTWFTNAYTLRTQFVQTFTANQPQLLAATSNQLVSAVSLIQSSALASTALQAAAH
jgi:hypothetical protein